MAKSEQNEKNRLALILTDSHCGKENINDFILNWDEAISICNEKGIKQILFVGDLVLSRAAQTLDILLAIHDVLENCLNNDIQVTLINGNHCKVNQESKRGYCDIFDSFENVRVINEWGEVRFSDSLSVGMISYYPENGSFCTKLDELEKYIFNIPYEYRILMIHQGIRGGLSQPTENELPSSIFSKWDKVFVGHYHNRCTLKGTQIEYIGSSRQHNFGEDEEKGYTVLYSDGSYEFIKNQVNTRYQVIDTDADKVDIHLSDLLEEIKADGRYKVKVRVHASTAKAPGIDKNILLNAGATKVEVITDEPEITETRSTSLFEKFDFHNIQVNYQEFCRLKDIDNVSLGITYLSKIKN